MPPHATPAHDAIGAPRLLSSPGRPVLRSGQQTLASRAKRECGSRRLRELERLAIEAEPRDAYDFIRKVGHEVNRAYAAALDDLAPNLSEEMAKQVLLNGVAIVSVIRAPIAALAGAASEVSASRAFRRSWVAAVMFLARARGR